VSTGLGFERAFFAFDGDFGRSWTCPFGFFWGGVSWLNRFGAVVTLPARVVDWGVAGLASNDGTGRNDVDFGVAIIVVGLPIDNGVGRP
jgi:hypothetical protein